MRYHKKTTISHPLSISHPQHIEQINTIIRNEGGTIFPFTNNEVALNLDKVKKNSTNNDINRMKSMDIVIGLNNTSGNSPLSLLVDFKLNCNGTKSISDGDYKDKIKHSKILLFGSGMPVHNKYVFIFKDSLINQSRSIISRILNNPLTDVLKINEFKTKYFN
jgi:hypothetical protein